MARCRFEPYLGELPAAATLITNDEYLRGLDEIVIELDANLVRQEPR